MKTIITIIIKEFKQIFRDKGMLPLIFIMPFIQLVILANATTFEVNNIEFAVVDYDKSITSRELTEKFRNNTYFTFIDYYENMKAAEEQLRRDRIDAIIRFSDNFEKKFILSEPVRIQVIINAIDNGTAHVINSYIQKIINDFQLEKTDRLIPVKIDFTNRYNKELNYKFFMVPGILVVLVSIIGMFLASMSLAKEKEIGTIEQLNVTPIKKYQLITGKLLPVLFIGLVELGVGLLIAQATFSIPVKGSILLLFSFAAIFLIIMLGCGLIISTLAENQQQAMFLSWFFMVLFILLSGLFTPIESMPLWVQTLTRFIPTSYFIKVVRSIMLKGSGFHHLQKDFIILSCFAVSTAVLAIIKYRKID